MTDHKHQYIIIESGLLDFVFLCGSNIPIPNLSSLICFGIIIDLSINIWNRLKVFQGAWLGEVPDCNAER